MALFRDDNDHFAAFGPEHLLRRFFVQHVQVGDGFGIELVHGGLAGAHPVEVYTGGVTAVAKTAAGATAIELAGAARLRARLSTTRWATEVMRVFSMAVGFLRVGNGNGNDGDEMEKRLA